VARQSITVGKDAHLIVAKKEREREREREREGPVSHVPFKDMPSWPFLQLALPPKTPPAGDPPST
jgi:hypothetical protein